MKISSLKIYLFFLVAILTTLLISLPSSALANEYTFTTIDVSGAPETYVRGINDKGEIVGSYGSFTSGTHGFLYAGGGFTRIDFLGNTWANGINNSGDIVGYGTSPWYHNFLYSGGIFTTIDVPGATTNWGAKGINDKGEIVGSYGDATGRPGFLYSGGIFTPINVPGAVNWTVPTGINNWGDIVGIYTNSDAPGTYRGFLYAGGIFTLIDVPGATNGTEVDGINDKGEIVGTYYDTAGGHIFLYAGGNFTTIDVPSAAYEVLYREGATGINNRGDIVGYYVDVNQVRHGFLATPVPEPSLMVLLGISIASIVGLKRWWKE